MRISIGAHKKCHKHQKNSVTSENFAFLASLLRNHGEARALSDGRCLHAHLSIHGYDGNTFLGNCLVQMYGNCGSVLEAQAVFDKLTTPNLYSWNILIKALGQNGRLEVAEAVFNLIPNPDLYSWNSLIRAYRQKGTLEDVRRVFDKLPYRNVVSWTAVIAAFAQDGHGHEALGLFRQMQLEGIEPDKLTFVRILDACSGLLAVEEGLKIHAAIVGSRYEDDNAIGTSLVNMYGKCGSLPQARSAFGTMSQKDLVSWTAIIAAFAQNGHCKEALDIFHQMQLEGVKPDNVTFVCILDACASVAAMEEGKEIHIAVVEDGYEQDLIVATAIVNMYGKCRDFEDATSVFDSMSFRNTVSWNAMISASAQNGCSMEALDLFRQMQLKDILPDKITFVCVLDACGNLEALEAGQEIHTAVIGLGYEQDTVVANGLINMYGKCGRVFSACDVFQKMLDLDTIAWNVLLSIFLWNGLEKEALHVFHLMQPGIIRADKITFAYALDACGVLTDLQGGQRIHAIVIESGLEQEALVGTALIAMYSKCQSFYDAKHVFLRMAYLDAICWTAMIGACVQNGHDKEALHLFWKMYLEGIEPDNVTFACSLDGCSALAAVEEGQKIHAAIIARELDRDVFVGNALINMYGKCGNLQHARNVFGNMLYPNVASWNVMIASVAQNGQDKDALDCFQQMQYKKVKPDGITFICLLSACSHTGRIDDGRNLFFSMSRDYCLPYTDDHYVCIVDLVSRAGHLDEAEALLNSMPVGNASVAWLCLLGACRLHGDHDRAVRVAKHCIELDSKNAAPYIMLSNVFATISRWDYVAYMRRALKGFWCS